MLRFANVSKGRPDVARPDDWWMERASDEHRQEVEELTS
jgi:hypothetical protein